MADNYDGSVVIKTGLDLEKIQQDAEGLKKAIAAATAGVKDLQAVAKASSAAQVKALQEANAGWAEQLRLVKEIREALTGMPTMAARGGGGTGAKESDEYKRAVAELARSEALFERLRTREAALEDKYGDKARNLKSYQLLVEQQLSVQERIATLREQIAALESSGGRYVAAPVAQTKQETKATQQLTQSYSQLATVTRQAKTEAVKTTKAVHRHSALSLKNVLKYALGIRSMFFLMRRLRAAAKESLGVMAQFDPQLNGAISEFLTSVRQLKADLGTMLQPLVQAAAPLFANLLNKVHALALELSKFVAALVGQDYIEVATVEAANFADSMGEAADATKEALGEYDKLSVISTDSNKDNAKALGLTKDTVKYTKQALNNNSWTVKLGKKLREIFAYAGGKLQDLRDWLEKQPFVQKIVDNLKELLSSPEGFLTLIGATLVVSKLVSMLSGGVTAGLKGSIASVSAMKLVLLATIAVAGYKLGNKIYEALPDDIKDYLGKSTLDMLIEFNIVDEDGNPRSLGDIVKDNLNPKNWISIDKDKGITGMFYKLGERARKAFGYGWDKEDEGSTQHGTDNGHKHSGGGATFTPTVIIEPEYSISGMPADVRERLRKEAVQKFLENMRGLKATIEFAFEAKFGVTPQAALDALGTALKAAWAASNTKKAMDEISSSVRNWWNSLWDFGDSSGSGSGQPGTRGGGVKNTVLSAQLATPIEGAAKQVAAALANNSQLTSAGTTAAATLVSSFNSYVASDTSMAKTFASKIVQVITAAYPAAASTYVGLYSALIAGQVTPTNVNKTVTSSTQNNGDIVLKLDGKEVARSVWDNTKQVYKQTGKNQLIY